MSKKFDDSDRKNLDEIVDNVYILDHYKERKLLFQEAMSLIRESHLPDMFDEPNALVEAKVELDLRTKRKTKFIESFRGIVSYPNQFEFATKRKVVAICNAEKSQEEAKNAGAEIVGSSEVIRMLKVGDLSMENFDDLVCHGDMIIELAAIKGILGPFFPNKQRGNIGFDMHRLVSYFVNGLEFKLVKDSLEPDYGFVQIPFGRLSMDDAALQDNLITLLNVIEENQPAGAPCELIRRVLLMSQPSPEKFAIQHWKYVENYDDPDEDGQDEIQQTSTQKQVAKN